MTFYHSPTEFLYRVIRNASSAEAETMSSYLAFYEVICLSHLPSVSNFYSTLEIYNMPLDRSPDSK